MNDIVQEGIYDNSNPKIAAIGRVLMDRAVTTKDDELSNKMSRLGDELTRFGTAFGARDIKELVKKSGLEPPMIQKLMQFGQAELKKSGDVRKGADVPDEPEDDDL